MTTTNNHYKGDYRMSECNTCGTRYGGHSLGCAELTTPRTDLDVGAVIWADGRSDEFKAGYSLGFHDGSKDDAVPILTRLLAELRLAHAEDHPEHEILSVEWRAVWHCCLTMAAIVRAEARLREAIGDE